MRTNSHHSDESRQKISKALQGYVMSQEIKQKISNSRLGHSVGQETRSKISESLRDTYVSGKLTSWSKGLTKLTNTSLLKISQKSLGNKNVLGYKKTPEQRAVDSKNQLQRWENPEYRERQIKAIIMGSRIKPNKAEMKLSYILRNIAPGEFKYNGDLRLGFILSGKVPDFVNINSRKQLIELYGDFWHKGENPQKRVSIFKRFGYDTLIIWEHELYNNRDKLKGKIISFVRGKM